MYILNKISTLLGYLVGGFFLTALVALFAAGIYLVFTSGSIWIAMTLLSVAIIGAVYMYYRTSAV